MLPLSITQLVVKIKRFSSHSLITINLMILGEEYRLFSVSLFHDVLRTWAERSDRSFI
jgi:hypothetical protein